jgi:ATP-dependent metalloprotease
VFKFAGIANSAREEESVGSLSAFKNLGKATKDGILGTAGTPIHMVATEGGHFKEQLWRTIRTIALAFLLMSGVGALIEDRGISKGITMSCYYRCSSMLRIPMKSFLCLFPLFRAWST